MTTLASKTREPWVASRRLVIIAELMTLIVYLLGLQFLLNTTGGTLFLFSTVAPVLVLLAIAALAIVGFRELRRRHSLFDFQNFASGEIIFRQGDEGDVAYFIQRGEVRVVRYNEKGGETVLARLTQGDYFGEMALIANQPRNATVRAASPTRCAVLGKRNFLLMLNVLPSTQEDIMKTMKDRALKEAAR